MYLCVALTSNCFRLILILGLLSNIVLSVWVQQVLRHERFLVQNENDCCWINRRNLFQNFCFMCENLLCFHIFGSSWIIVFIVLARHPPMDQGLLIHEFSKSHIQRRNTVGSNSLDEWSARRTDLYLTTHTTLTTDKLPCHRWDSNPHSQQESGRRPTP